MKNFLFRKLWKMIKNIWENIGEFSLYLFWTHWMYLICNE